MTMLPAFSIRVTAALLLVACVLPFTPASNAQGTASHPLTGSWTWTLFSGQCQETLQYRTEGVLLSTSGEAVATWRYQVSAAPDAKGFYKVLETSVRSNDKKDCHQDTLGDDEITVTRFIQLSPAKDRLIVCKTDSLVACYGPLKRELP